MSRPTRRPPPADGGAAVLAKIAEMPGTARAMGERLHALILDSVPSLQPRIWYGMPGYAKSKDGPVLCFFRRDETYMTFGLTEKARHSVEAGAGHQLMASAWYFTELDEATEVRLGEIVRQAVG